MEVFSMPREKWWIKERPQPEPADEAPDLESLSKADLVAEAESRGVDATGTKAEILERLSDD